MKTDPVRTRLLAFAVIAVGAVVAIEPYLVTRDAAWDWTFDRTAMALVPGAAVVLGGLAMALGGRPLRAGSALLAFTAGVWLMTGPALSVVWPDGALGLAAQEEAPMRTLQWATFFFGLGAIAAGIAVYVLHALFAPAPRAPAPPARRLDRSHDCRPRHRAGARRRQPLRRDQSHAGARKHVHG